MTLTLMKTHFQGNRNCPRSKAKLKNHFPLPPTPITNKSLPFFMSFPINADDLHKIFTRLDYKGDGIITIDQLKWLLERIGCPASLEELQALVGQSTSLDAIDFFLFYDIAVKRNSIGRGDNRTNEASSSDGDLAEAFKVFDLNGDGFISSEELQNVLLRFGLWDEHEGRDCKSMIRKFDTNSDGLLDFEEFRNMMLVSSSS